PTGGRRAATRGWVGVLKKGEGIGGRTGRGGEAPPSRLISRIDHSLALHGYAGTGRGSERQDRIRAATVSERQLTVSADQSRDPTAQERGGGLAVTTDRPLAGAPRLRRDRSWL